MQKKRKKIAKQYYLESDVITIIAYLATAGEFEYDSEYLADHFRKLWKRHEQKK